MKHVALVLIATCVLTACDIPQGGTGPSTPQPRYQLVAIDGHVYRLDAVTGAVALISPDGMLVLPEGFQRYESEPII